TGVGPRWREQGRRGDGHRRRRRAAGGLRGASALAGARRPGARRARGARGGRPLDGGRGEALRGALRLLPREPARGTLSLPTLRITGHDLTIADVVDVARRRESVALD